MACTLCEGKELSTVSMVDAKSRKPLHVAICRICGLVQQDPIPSTQELEQFYSHHYRHEYKKTDVPKPKHIYRAGLTAINRLSFLQTHGLPGRTLLDLGAGGGEFVYLARAQGYEAVGVEPNIGYSEFAKTQYGVNVITGDLGAIGGRYDVITMFHVLEHLPNFETFQVLWSKLNDRGSLFIEVPNIETPKTSPHNIFFKAHIFYFSQATLTACASRYFEPVVIEADSALRIVFRKRRREAPLSLPTQQDVDQVFRRLRRKGWCEYLFAGGGIMKGFSKLRQMQLESRVTHQSGAHILDALLATQAPRGRPFKTSTDEPDGSRTLHDPCT
jgi:2-polyprenyl-3-methyl-5-hydroxy-6-metoxy-1,4-benzoquinol methylase